MWAIRKSSVGIRSRPFSSVTFRACDSKVETSPIYMDNTGFGEPPLHIFDKSLLLKRFFPQPHGAQISFIRNHSFSSQAGTKSSGKEDDDFTDDFSVRDATRESDNELISEADLSEFEDEDNDIAGEVPQNELDLLETEEGGAKNCGRAASSGLCKAIVDSPSRFAKNALDEWLEEGNDLSKSEMSLAMHELRRRKMYGKALQLSEWLESQKVEFDEGNYASRVDLIAKIYGLREAENYIKKIPESFKGQLVYQPLLANCVLKSNKEKAEQVFNKMKDLKSPITVFAYDQLILLYKRTDRRKIADVLLLMEKENIKPSLFTYGLLIDTTGRAHDFTRMEQILETMKSDGLEPNFRVQFLLARQYAHGGMKEKAKAVLKEMEGSDLNEKRRACSSLLPIYALLGSGEDVKRVWGVCESDPTLEECNKAIDAWGKLKKVEEAEAVFDQMLMKCKTLSAKHYTAMLKVYVNNKMLSKGKDLANKMNKSGCRIGPLTWDALVKLYLESGEFKKADWILNRASREIQTRPYFSTYMMILEHYAKRGDVYNAEKIFHWMRQDGYGGSFRQYSSLLQAYINGKAPAFGFRERMKADDVFPSKAMAAQLAEADPFKTTTVSTLLD